MIPAEQIRRTFSKEILEALKDQAFDVDEGHHPPIIVVALNYPTGWIIEHHSHKVHQLVYCSKGVLTIKTSQGIWIAPPHRAIWIPANEHHAIYVDQAASMRTVYVDDDVRPNLSKKPSAVNMSSILRELILRAAEYPIDYEPSDYMTRLMTLILDEILLLPENPLHLHYPQDSRLAPICKYILENPAEKQTISHWAKVIGTTERTVERLFQRDTNMSFHTWRTQAKLLKSLTLLREGRTVKTVSYELGFKRPSTFIAMFKRLMGVTPKNYLKNT